MPESLRDNKKILCRQFLSFKKISARKREEVLMEYLRIKIILCIIPLSDQRHWSEQPHVKRIRGKRYSDGKESIARSSGIAIENLLARALLEGDKTA